MEDLKRVFIHELGHFVAREINHRYYGATPVKNILIYPHNAFLYEGETNPVFSEDEREKNAPAKKDLAAYLALTVYGCFFQCYYLKQSLGECFKENGYKDTEQWHGSLREHHLDDYRSEITPVEEEFFERLKAEEILKDFMELEPEKYLLSNGTNSFKVNLDLLRADTDNLIAKHHDTYQQLIDSYEAFINKQR